MENYVIQTVAGAAGKACVFNGPVFDAPLSRKGPERRLISSLKGKRHPDATFGGFTIPKIFFKVVVSADGGGGLKAALFLMSQEDYLVTVDRLQGMPAAKEEKLSVQEARLFQVRVGDIATFTGLDFGTLGDADTLVNEALGTTSGGEIRALEDVRL